MGLVGDRDRERTAGALRRHYVDGRLTEAELEARLGAALRARTRLDLMLAARGLPDHSPVNELLAPRLQAASRTVRRVAVFVVLAALWSVMSVVFLLTFALTALINGAGTATVLGLSLAWALMTWLVWRTWQRSGVTPR